MNALHYSRRIEHLTEDFVDETGLTSTPRQRVAAGLAVVAGLAVEQKEGCLVRPWPRRRP